jgi:hypothetical protein
LSRYVNGRDERRVLLKLRSRETEIGRRQKIEIYPAAFLEIVHRGQGEREAVEQADTIGQQRLP